MLDVLIYAPVAVVTTTITTFLLDKVIQRGKRVRANDRLKAAPLVYVGAKYNSVVSESSGAKLVGKCEVTALEVGRVEVTTVTGDKMSWTGQEFEGLHPLYSKDNE